MALGYGVTHDGDSACTTSFDSVYFQPDHNCSFVTDGKSNDAVVCANAGITNEDGKNWCDISFSGTNDAVDVLSELLHVFAPAAGRQIKFRSGENEISFTALEFLATIGFGPEEGDEDGIVEIAYQAAADKGCFTGENAAIHFMCHTLGAVMCNFFVLKLAAEYPDVHVKMTTAGEPSILVEPLEGRAATLQAWSNKVRYINGRVLPRGQVFDNFLGPRDYGLYQDYCWVSQVLPGGHVAGNNTTDLFYLCEVKEGNSLTYFIAGPEGCADGRTYVLNELPTFPHKGGVDLLPDEDEATEVFENLKNLLDSIGLDGLADVLDFFNVVFPPLPTLISAIRFIKSSICTFSAVRSTT